MIESRQISLPNGNILHVKLNPGFLDKVRQQFNIEAADPVSDDHIRMFFFGAVKSAMEKAELTP